MFISYYLDHLIYNYHNFSKVKKKTLVIVLVNR